MFVFAHSGHGGSWAASSRVTFRRFQWACFTVHLIQSSGHGGNPPPGAVTVQLGRGRRRVRRHSRAGARIQAWTLQTPGTPGPPGARITPPPAWEGGHQERMWRPWGPRIKALTVSCSVLGPGGLQMSQQTLGHVAAVPSRYCEGLARAPGLSPRLRRPWLAWWLPSRLRLCCPPAGDGAGPQVGVE